jgi:hypothetical protein
MELVNTSSSMTDVYLINIIESINSGMLCNNTDVLISFKTLP